MANPNLLNFVNFLNKIPTVTIHPIESTPDNPVPKYAWIDERPLRGFQLLYYEIKDLVKCVTPRRRRKATKEQLPCRCCKDRQLPRLEKRLRKAERNARKGEMGSFETEIAVKY